MDETVTKPRTTGSTLLAIGRGRVGGERYPISSTPETGHGVGGGGEGNPRIQQSGSIGPVAEPMVMGVETEDRMSHTQSGTFELHDSPFEAKAWSSCNFATVVEDSVFDKGLHNLSSVFIEDVPNV